MEAAEPEKSVIQIFTFSQEPDWDEPWNSSQVRRATGSGFVIEGDRIMTNAHVVSWAKQNYGSPLSGFTTSLGSSGLRGT